MSRGALLRQPRFLTMVGAFSLGMLAQISFIAHQVAFLEPTLGLKGAGWLVSVTSLAALVGRLTVGEKAFVTLNAFPDRRVPGKVVEIGKRMGRKNVRTDDPTERIDTKILEVVIQLDDKTGLLPGLRVVAYVGR